MSQSLQMLEEVARLAKSEFNLLELEDLEGLNESAQKRSDLLKQAWANVRDCNDLDFVSMLMDIQAMQRRLEEVARKKLVATRDEMNMRKKSKNAVMGYCKTGVGYGKKSAKMLTTFS